jgi:hypothetical protein
MSLNLNTQAGLNALAGASNLLGSLTGAISQQWDIDEGSYGHNGLQILFHVFKTATDNFDAAVDQVQDTSGRRKIPLIFPYTDGQSTDDIGRNGEIFDVNVLIFGPNYKNQYKKLLKELNDPRPGDLIHPVRGKITVAANDWVTTHSSDKKQAVALRIRFIEHSFSVSFSDIPNSKNVQSALTTAIGFVAKIANTVATVQSVAFVAIATKNLVASLLSKNGDDYSSTLTKLNQTFNPGNLSLIPGLAPTVAGQDPSLFSVATSPSNAFSGTAQVQTGQASQALTSALAAQQAVDTVAALRLSFADSITQMAATEGGQGSLIFYDQILILKQSVVSITKVLELGLQSSNNKIVNFTTPRDMSVREVCFANGLVPDNSIDVEVLNPNLLSLNLIPKGTLVLVPT